VILVQQNSYVLGIKVERDRANRTISLSQSSYIQAIFDEHLPAPSKGMNSVRTPMLDNSKLSSEDCPSTLEEKAKIKDSRYLEIIGKLLYVGPATRPDIAYALDVLCGFGANPGPKHLLRYLVGTANMKLVYSPTSSSDLIETYGDASLDGDSDTSKSTGGFTILLGSGATMWASRLQRYAALSSTESEYVNASLVGQEMMWMCYFFDELGYDVSTPSLLFQDNNSAALVVRDPENQSTMKPVHLNYNWIRLSCVNLYQHSTSKLNND
jgi:hypothetical protein